jgi:hypothetical protein
MRFKMAPVPIYRPGINLTFLKSGFWRFDVNNPEYMNTMISDGKTPPDGLMPAISTDIILVRDLSIDFGESNSRYSQEAEKVSGGGGMSWGPFHIGGKHTNSKDERSASYTWDNQGLHIKGMQALGFLIWEMDKSPNPNPSVQSWI